MGLDMYLFRRNQEPFYDEKGHRELGDEVMYWRKANQIREWFVNNAGYPYDANCMEFALTKNDLTQLKNDCKFVLENHSYADNVLPTSCGFFFGNGDYDDYYFDTIKQTYEIVDELLDTTNFDEQEIIYYEWW